MPIPIALGAALIGAGTSIGGGLIQSASQRRRERRAMENQRQLMDLQQQHQMELNKQGQQIQLDTWEKTNYPAQVKMLQEAGMNPALLYGKGGSGGVTGSQGGGSAAGGSAPSPQHMPNYLDLNAIANLALINSQSKVNEAQAEKLKAETSLTGQKTETEKATLENVAADTANKKAQGEILEIDRTIKELDSKLKSSSIHTQIETLNEQLTKLKQEIRVLKTNAEVSEQTFKNVLQLSKLEVLKSTLQNTLIKSQIAKTNNEADAITKEITLKYEQLELNKATLTNEQYRTKLQEFSETIKANYPNVWNHIGGMLNNIFLMGADLLGAGLEDGMPKYERPK